MCRAYSSHLYIFHLVGWTEVHPYNIISSLRLSYNINLYDFYNIMRMLHESLIILLK